MSHMRITQISLLGVLGALSLLAYNWPKIYRSEESQGWTPEKAHQAPFDSTAMLVGVAPEKFEVLLIGQAPSFPITMKPLETRAFAMLVRGLVPSNKVIERPPSRVKIELFRGKQWVSGNSMVPTSLTDEGHIYSGKLTAPKEKGTYTLVGDAEYWICDDGIGKLIQRETFHKKTEALTLYVR